jgi:hypothetical protein
MRVAKFGINRRNDQPFCIGGLPQRARDREQAAISEIVVDEERPCRLAKFRRKRSRGSVGWRATDGYLVAASELTLHFIAQRTQ